MPMGGGAPRAIAEFIDKADWTPDGKQLAILRFAEGRNRVELPLGKVIYASERGIRLTRVSPRGDRVAMFGRSPAGEFVVGGGPGGQVHDSGQRRIRGQGLAWSPSGDEVWFDDVGERGQFLLKAVDLGGRVRVIDSLPVGLIVHDISRDGRVLVERYSSQPGILGLAPGETTERELSWFDRSSPAGLSDDGRSLLINEFGDAAGRNGAYYVRRTDGSPAVKLGEGAGLEISSDGKWVLARPPGSEKSLVLAPTGTGAPVTVNFPAFERVGNEALFPDAKRLLLQGVEPGGKLRLYVQDLPSGKPRPITDRAYGFAPGNISSDGRWAAAWGEWTEDLFLIPIGGGDPEPFPTRRTSTSSAGRPTGSTSSPRFPAAFLRASCASRSRPGSVSPGKTWPRRSARGSSRSSPSS